MSEPSFRPYDPRDGGAVVTLHEWAMRDAGTDPSDIPGSEDVHDIEGAYLDAGGAFLVGVLTESTDRQLSESAGRQLPETFDGRVVAIGGLLPNKAGHADERTVAGSAELHRMRVAPPYQGRGYGRTLLDLLEKRAKEAGYRVLLATTSRRQERAIRLYELAGYTKADESTFQEYDLVHFEKEL